MRGVKVASGLNCEEVLDFMGCYEERNGLLRVGGIFLRFSDFSNRKRSIFNTVVTGNPSVQYIWS